MFRLVLLTLLVAALLPGIPFHKNHESMTAAPLTPPPPGEREMQALAAAWPDRITQSALRDGDWMVLLGDEWFAWANGRMLPEGDRGDWEKYAPMNFYRYP